MTRHRNDIRAAAPAGRRKEPVSEGLPSGAAVCAIAVLTPVIYIAIGLAVAFGGSPGGAPASEGIGRIAAAQAGAH